LARTDLEAILRARKLDRTVARPDATPDSQQILPTGMAALDARLGGGLPRGQVSELTGVRSSGRTSLMSAMLAAATHRSELVALVDPLDMFDPESAASCGVLLDRVLWLRGDASSRGPERTRAQPVYERALDRGVKALNLVLQAGGFDLVVFDMADVPADAIRRLPFTTWFRLQRVVEGSRTACLVIAPVPTTRSADGVSIQLSHGERRRDATREWNERLFLGFELSARIVRACEPEEAAVDLRFRA
jgi:hypothetical protein